LFRTHAPRPSRTRLGRHHQNHHQRHGCRTRGVPVLQSLPLVGWAFSSPVMAIIYVFVAVKLFLGYSKTTFGNSVNPLVMCGLWPVLAIVSQSFRDNIKRAM
ncbi:hypothetical protein BE221DRAFT_66734, partial [Ostreococcus tauri]